MSAPTRTAGTVSAYLRRAEQLLGQLDREHRAEHRTWEPADLVEFLAARSASLAHASWRQYKASLIALAQVRATDDVRWAAVAEKLITLTWKKPDLATPLPKRTSARKQKSPEAKDVIALHSLLVMSDPLSSEFLQAAWLCGLRPSEWSWAELKSDGDGWALVARNGKATNGRANGAFRTLRFSTLDFKQVMAIRGVIRAFSNAEALGVRAALQKRIEEAFRAGNQELWPRRKKRITPYSLRHAFAGRIKLSFEAAEVAALMGQASDETAYTHYGRISRKGAGGVSLPMPRPDPREVQHVRPKRASGLDKLASIKAGQRSGFPGLIENERQPPSDSDEAVWHPKTTN